MSVIPKDPTPDLVRLAVLGVAGAVIALSLYSLFSAATQWTSLPTNPIVILYFTVVLIVVPLLAVRAIMLAWANERLTTAAVLAAISAGILILRAMLVGGI
jgi:hypothetical protein